MNPRIRTTWNLSISLLTRTALLTFAAATATACVDIGESQSSGPQGSSESGDAPAPGDDAPTTGEPSEKTSSDPKDPTGDEPEPSNTFGSSAGEGGNSTADPDDSTTGHPQGPTSGGPCLKGACGNDILDAGETCDGGILGDTSCASLGLQDGALTCAADCQAFNTLGCVGP